MRKIFACEFMTLDGVIQNEDEGDGFKYGGWFFPYRRSLIDQELRNGIQSK